MVLMGIYKHIVEVKKENKIRSTVPKGLSCHRDPIFPLFWIYVLLNVCLLVVLISISLHLVMKFAPTTVYNVFWSVLKAINVKFKHIISPPTPLPSPLPIFIDVFFCV